MKSPRMKCIVYVQLLAIGWILGIMPAFADTMPLKYGDFYSHLKKLDEEDTPALQFAFGFSHIQHKRLCKIESVNIVTQKQTIEIAVSDENRFMLPTEKALKQARAIVEVTLDDNSHQCDMSVQLETKPAFLKTQYSSKELSELFDQYAIFFDDMGGLFSFLMPDVSGLVLHFAEALPAETISLSDSSLGMMVTEQKIALSPSWLALANALSLPQKPMRITASTNKD